jgi:hypothetical protein
VHRGKKEGIGTYTLLPSCRPSLYQILCMGEGELQSLAIDMGEGELQSLAIGTA